MSEKAEQGGAEWSGTEQIYENSDKQNKGVESNEQSLIEQPEMKQSLTEQPKMEQSLTEQLKSGAKPNRATRIGAKSNRARTKAKWKKQTSEKAYRRADKSNQTRPDRRRFETWNRRD